MFGIAGHGNKRSVTEFFRDRPRNDERITRGGEVVDCCTWHDVLFLISKISSTLSNFSGLSGHFFKALMRRGPYVFFEKIPFSTGFVKNKFQFPRKSYVANISFLEIVLFQGIYSHELKEKLEESMIFGGYPEVVTETKKSQNARLLEELVQSCLIKDILELERVKSSKTILDLLRLIAFQIGSEVSLTELSQHLGIDYKTVGRYLDLFEKSFILYNLRGFSRNLRKEITRKSKYYFLDNGIRNAVISNFNAMELRNDSGPLWENFILTERLKKRAYQDIFSNAYFWRTWEQQEIDLVEEREGKLFAFECKWGNRQVKPPSQWSAAYPGASFEIIDKSNYLPFIA
jgi:predicted AAA+ superfamily ATPase